jgi:hypothetical protein
LPKGKPHSKHYGPLRQYERFKYIFLQLSRKRKFSLLSPAFGARKVRFIFFVLGKNLSCGEESRMEFLLILKLLFCFLGLSRIETIKWVELQRTRADFIMSL